MTHQLHVAKVPTSNPQLFPYSHYADAGHNPQLQVEEIADGIRLVCSDLFKLKPNVQQNPRTRIDLYMPGESAASLGADILAVVGAGNIAELAQVDPEAFRSGPQALPVINEARRVSHSGADVEIAGYLVAGRPGSVYLDQEAPSEGHIEMRGPEVHIGVPLTEVTGDLDTHRVVRVDVPVGELRVGGERNPNTKAEGVIRVAFAEASAADLAATLLHYGR